MTTTERGKSNVNVTPRGNNVLVKMEFLESVLNLYTGKPSKASDAKVTFTVEGIGPNVSDLELGEEVMMELVEYSDIPVEGNHNGIKTLLDIYPKMKNNEIQELMKDSKTAKVLVRQYGIFPEFQIKSIVR
jgi:hypothetical protein